MARYIDADALIKKIFPYDVVDKKCYTINAKMIYEEIQKAPTADVAPKSEVAREIFEEIENFIPRFRVGYFSYRSLAKGIAELKKKYTERCTDCKHFVGCECFSGMTCDEYTEVEK